MPAEETDDALGASYRLVELIGRGAAGEVWRGVDRRNSETIAAKLLRREHVEDPELVDRFLRERSILIKLRHPNVVAVRDLVVEGERLAIVMEFVAGGSLREALRGSGPLPAALAVDVTAAVLDGLAAAHDRNVLHRDVKPDNVLLTPDWRDLGRGSIKLSDFGIARLLAEEGSTSTGLVGTPEYMAPEQLLTGEGDRPADVYAAGILAYELLAGRTPFAGPGTGYAIAHRHVSSLPPRLPVRGAVERMLVRLLDKDPGRRPTAHEAAAQLRALREEVADLPALPAQEAPEQFGAAGGPATEVRGLLLPVSTAGAAVGADAAAAPSVPMPDVGTPGQATVLRSMPTLPAPVEARPVGAPAAGDQPAWRRPRNLVLILTGALLVAGGVFFWIHAGTKTPAGPPPGTTAVRAQQQSAARPSGLGITREATWDPQSQSAELTITYSAERAPLTGPFLEVVPEVKGRPGCPAASWQEGAAKLNLPAVTGIDTACAWSVAAPAVPARQSIAVTATVPLALPTGDAEGTLQGWLDSVAAATEAASTDSAVTSTAYAAQRLTDVQVVAPTRTVSGKTLRISVLPVWPSGADPLNPLFRSPPTGRASSLLVATAGGKNGVRFSDGCGGALAISKDGLVVTAASIADTCQVDARVGNFTDLTSNSFAITTRGS